MNKEINHNDQPIKIIKNEGAKDLAKALASEKMSHASMRQMYDYKRDRMKALGADLYNRVNHPNASYEELKRDIVTILKNYNLYERDI